MTFKNRPSKSNSTDLERFLVLFDSFVNWVMSVFPIPEWSPEPPFRTPVFLCWWSCDYRAIRRRLEPIRVTLLRKWFLWHNLIFYCRFSNVLNETAYSSATLMLVSSAWSVESRRHNIRLVDLQTVLLFQDLCLPGRERSHNQGSVLPRGGHSRTEVLSSKRDAWHTEREQSYGFIVWHKWLEHGDRQTNHDNASHNGRKLKCDY